MNILVCLKMVSQAQFTDLLTAPSGERLAGGQLVLNPADAYALELALRYKDRFHDTHITAMTMGPACAGQILRAALAMGADRAVHISDPAFAGSDTVSTAGILCAAVKALPKQELILCGKKAIDSETGHVGPQLGLLLGVPVLTNVMSFSPAGGDGLELVCARDNAVLRLRAPFPVLLTVCNGTDMIRQPTIRGLRRAAEAELYCLDRQSLGLDAACVGLRGSGTETVAMTEQVFRQRRHEQTAELSRGVGYLLGQLLAEGGGA